MRLVSAAVAALAVLSAAVPALAGQDARPAVQTTAQARAADAEFHRIADNYEWRMRLMAEEMGRASNLNEMRAIEARYQPEADAFADAIDARLAAEQRTIRPYDNARKVRNMPKEIRENLVRARLRADNSGSRMGNATMNAAISSGPVTTLRTLQNF
ncbi:MAG: hypothetical protein EBR82_16775 [Caulobacteraceae bacterium]|nr:hypothetical protein [Caulobacteraceae bacterium]